MEQKEPVPARAAAPTWLVVAAAWGWRLLVLVALGYVIVRVLAMLVLVVLAFLAALALTALLRPVTMLLMRRLPGLLAAWLTLLIAVVVLGGIGYVVGLRAAAALPSLADQLATTGQQLLKLVQQSPLVQDLQLDRLRQAIISELQQHRQRLTNLVIKGAQRALEIAAGLILMIFITFFLVYQGGRIWRWLLAPLPGGAGSRIDEAGRRAWTTIEGYVRGTIVIATIHAVVISITLVLLGVPLVAPLAVLVFLGSFIPIVGALVAGGIAVLVTLGAQGLLDAVILLAVLVVENQLEGNLLQPVVMGRYVRLHPLAIGVVLAVGAVLAGIVGAIVAVPAAAVIYRAVPVLLRWDGGRVEGGRADP